MIIQDDTGEVEGADAYISVEYMIQYNASRGRDVESPESEIEAAIVNATDFIDRKYAGRFIGRRLAVGQETEWPRAYAYGSGTSSDYSETIPLGVSKACAELAYRALSGPLAPDPTRDESGMAIKSHTVKVDIITEQTVYDEFGYKEFPDYPAVDSLLIDLISFGGNVKFLMRG